MGVRGEELALRVVGVRLGSLGPSLGTQTLGLEVGSGLGVRSCWMFQRQFRLVMEKTFSFFLFFPQNLKKKQTNNEAIVLKGRRYHGTVLVLEKPNDCP